MSTSRCKKCGVEMEWRVSNRGKSIPVEMQEFWVLPGSRLGMIKAIVTEDGAVIVGSVVEAGTSGAYLGRESHFSSCPFAKSFRRAVELGKSSIQGLTVKQPFASAIVSGPKRVENREWPLKVPTRGMWLAIHAGGKFYFGKREWKGEVVADLLAQWPKMPMAIESFPMGAILGIAHLVGCWAYSDLPPEHKTAWAHGSQCFVFGEVIALKEPIPYKGSQGLWHIKRETVAELRAAYKASRPQANLLTASA